MATGFGEILRICPSLDDSGNGTSTANDLTGNGGDATLANVTWVADASHFGVRALFFDSTSDAGSGTVGVALSASPITLSMWVKTATPYLTTYPVWFAGGAWYLAGRADNLHFIKNSDTQLLWSGANNDLVADTWMHLCYTFDGTTVKFYLNGVYKRQLTATGTGMGTVTNYSLGNTLVGAADFTGYLDDVMIFDAVVSDTNIALLASKRGYQTGDSVSSITITEPASETVFQRDASDEASVTVSGGYVGSPATVEARLGSGAWVTLDASPTGGIYSGTLTGLSSAGASLEALQVRFSDDTDVSDSVNIGIGDVFLCAGQSNSEGNDWTILQGYLQTDQSVPVAFIESGASGSAISSWQPGQTNYDNMISDYTASAVNAVRAVLWHQGETDAITGQTQAAYNALLDSFCAAVDSDITFYNSAPKIIVAQIGQVKFGGTWYDPDLIRAAQAEAWDDNALAFEGPVLWPVVPLGDNLHFATTPAAAIQLNEQWMDAIDRWCYDGSVDSPQISAVTYTADEVTITFDQSLDDPGASYDIDAFTVYDDAVSQTISSAVYSAPNKVVLTMASEFSGSPTMDFGTGNLITELTFPVVPRSEDGYNKPSRPATEIVITAGESAIETVAISDAIALVGTSATVTWNSINSVGDVDIFLSLDDGGTYPITLSSDETDDESYSYTPTADHLTATARIKVVSSEDDTVFSESSSFKIATTTATGSNIWKSIVRQLAIEAGYEVIG